MSDMFDALPEVEVRDDVDARTFHGEILAAERPVVLKGLVAHWPAVAAGRTAPGMNAYLKAMDRGAPAPVMEAPAASGGRYFYTDDLREFNFTKRQRGVSETLDLIESHLGREDAPFVAIQMLPLATHLPDFVRANPLPLLPPQVMPRLWVGGPLRTQTHNDRDHNIACVVAGARRFVLFPPEQVANLYVGPLDNPPPLSLADPEQPDFARFPRFRAAMAAASVARLEAGDALFMPKYWWHHVTSLSPYNVLVNYWWGDTVTGLARGLESANDGFLTALLALKDLPPGQRRYWKAMFDTYVFQVDGDPMAHIPPARRGILGGLDPASRARLKAELKTAYLKS